MTLQDFIDQFDVAGTVVLLEGKRDVLPQDEEKLVQLGRLLAEKTLHIQFRSGNAAGADALFSQGVAEVDAERLEVVIPYDTHRKKHSFTTQVHSIDSMDIVEEEEVVFYSKTNKKTQSLVDRYVSGVRDRNAMKAAYIIRDTVKVLGSQTLPKAALGIFYDDLEKPQQGGTGHTMQVCTDNHVPMVDQRVWMEWC
ncbi:MAG: hypothetical protein LC107_11820 [Chitinophagales bacterium]|nr:hypothetical protein [Chitinophagales bacterium]